jgi:hypothetical protein
MHGVFTKRVEEARAIEGRLRQGTDEIVRPLFPEFAKLCFPYKTAACLAAIAHSDERAAYRWLSGEHEPPLCVVLAIINKGFGQYLRK